MALFGRETPDDRMRAERFKNWLDQRSPYAMPSAALGTLAVLDFVTVVLGVGLGLIAITLGLCGLADLRRRPELLGRPLCLAGSMLGGVGLIASTLWWVILA